MGSCASKGQGQPHERLNEFDEKYFIRVETRSPDDIGDRWRMRSRNNGTWPSRMDGNTLDDTLQDNSSNVPTQPWTLPPSVPSASKQGDATGVSSPTFSLCGTMPSCAVSGSSACSPIFSTPTSRPAIATDNDERVNGWTVKPKGHALQLRLANHRFLQIAVARQPSPNGSPISPITMDSTLETTTPPPGLINREDASSDWSPSSTRSKTRRGEGASIPNKDESIVNFDAKSGMIWKEITRDDTVTALAMSRATHLSPLMMAMGDEQGNIVVTQIVDEAVSTARLEGESSWPDSQLDLLPSEFLEFSIDERVRSLDFAEGRFLAVGGDCCCTWILQVIFDHSNQLLKDLVVIHKVERVDRIYSVRFSPDMRYLAIGGFDGKAALVPMEVVWKAKKAEIGIEESDGDSLTEVMQSSIVELDRSCLIYCLDWIPTGEYLAVAGSNKTCAIYETKGFDLIHETVCRSTAIQALQWNPNGTFLAIADRDVAIIEGKPPFNIHCEISHTPTDSAITRFRYRITSICWSPSGSYLAIGGVDGICLVVETKDYTLVHEVHRTDSITALAWGQQRYMNGDVRRYLALSDEDCNVALVKAGAEARGYETADEHSSVASSSYYSSASEWVLREDTFRDLEDAQPHRLQADLKAQGSNVTAVAFSKSGKSKTSSYLAFACDDCSLTIMTTRDWKAIFVSPWPA
jgi:WD40 repeat protein